jgi:tRNA threonylcarbamoyladenosine biosynthesis protein TsaE
VILSGELGAGKTTLTQGLGAGLQVRGPVTSPTFVIARLHPPLSTGAGLLHVDAYRMGDAAELDDLDLDTLTDRAVTVVEWGEGLAETLSTNRLHVGLARSSGAERTAEADVDAVGGSAEERRIITVTPVGERWVDAPLQQVLSSTESAANPNRPGPGVEP